MGRQTATIGYWMAWYSYPSLSLIFWCLFQDFWDCRKGFTEVGWSAWSIEFQASAMDASRGIMSGTMDRFKRVSEIFSMLGHVNVLLAIQEDFTMYSTYNSSTGSKTDGLVPVLWDCLIVWHFIYCGVAGIWDQINTDYIHNCGVMCGGVPSGVLLDQVKVLSHVYRVLICLEYENVRFLSSIMHLWEHWLAAGRSITGLAGHLLSYWIIMEWVSRANCLCPFIYCRQWWMEIFAAMLLLWV